MTKSSSPNPPGPDAEPPIVAFDGAITTHLLPAHQPNRTLAFSFKVTFNLSHPRLIALSARKPPLHFHPYQEEYIQVLEGRLGVDIEGAGERVIEAGDGELLIRPWVYHRLFPVWDPGEGDGDGDGDGDGAEGDDGEGQGKGKRCVFLLSGQDSGEPFRLDTMFFQNWYGYQDEVVMQGGGIDLIQVMCMFDAGASYLALIPSWIPLGKSLSRAIGVVVGRWLGGVLGYSPFFRKWTTDWEGACRKMESSMLQRRFADRKAKKV